MTVTLADLLKDSAYRLDPFKPEHIAALEAGITLKEAGKAAAPYVTCLARGKPIKLTPEEAVRQLYLRVLHLDMGYPMARMTVEYEVTRQASECYEPAYRMVRRFINCVS